MTGTIKYTSEGPRYFVNGNEVSREGYDRCFPSKLAEMLEEGVAPYGITDSTFMSGTANGRQFQGQDHIGDHYARVAKRAGVSVTGKKYLSQLAEYPGDPRAWVGGRGDVQRVCEERGWGCEGAVGVKGRQPEPGKSLKGDVADDLLNAEVEKICESIPEPLKPKEKADLKEKVRAKRRPKVK